MIPNEEAGTNASNTRTAKWSVPLQELLLKLSKETFKTVKLQRLEEPVATYARNANQLTFQKSASVTNGTPLLLPQLLPPHKFVCCEYQTVSDFYSPSSTGIYFLQVCHLCQSSIFFSLFHDFSDFFSPWPPLLFVTKCEISKSDFQWELWNSIMSCNIIWYVLGGPAQ